ncbi:MMPL family protein [Rubripirellula tenax]|uniref:MMPL family protein n=1 Tax=Rubripirellula tenax TaxID=2528015 RepID=A0A5C6FH66_9BACT|nr:MMPL family transporter [Rubripirellula tenax]TWU60200.1 MMPL family protein [Rubripirellula tenax]
MNRSPPRSYGKKVSDVVIRYRWFSLVAGLVIGLAAWPSANRVDFDRSISAMFAADDPTLLAYQELESAFGGNAVVMIVYEDDKFASSDGLVRNEALSAKVAAVPGVAGVLSPSVLNAAVERLRPASLFNRSAALFRKRDPVARGFLEIFAGYTHSSALDRAAVVAMLEPDHLPETIETLRTLASEMSDELESHNVALVGEPVLVHDGFDLIERDGARLAWTTIVLLSAVLLIVLQDLRLVALAALSIVWSVTLTKAIMHWWGIELSLVSTILTAIVTVVSVTAILHLGVAFRTARRRGMSQRAAMTKAMMLLSVPIFWTCATDAAGFAALAISRILPVAQFGIMVAIASIAVFLSLALFAPLILMTGSRWPDATEQKSHGRERLKRLAFQIASWSVRNRGGVIATGVLIAIASVIGLGRAEVETSFLNNFRPQSAIVQDYGNVESNFGGAGVWDIVLDTPDELTEAYMKSVRDLEEELRAIDVDGARLTKVISLADADAVALKVGILKLVSPSTRLSGMQVTMPVFFAALLSDPDDNESAKFRIMLRSEEHLDAGRKTALIDQVRRTVNDSDVGRGGRVTGYYVMMASLVGQMVGDQWRCFAASGVLVWLLLVVATRSVRLATSALLPNLLPVFVVLASVAMMGGKINMGAAMIAAVSIGLSIDGSVHFLAAFRRQIRRGHGGSAASVRAAAGIGAPVVLATVALVIGFGAMTTSEFVPTATFGTLVAATLAIGTFVNLTLLPAIASIGYR